MWAATGLSALSVSLSPKQPSQELQLLRCSSVQALEIEQLDNQSQAMRNPHPATAGRCASSYSAPLSPPACSRLSRAGRLGRCSLPSALLFTGSPQQLMLSARRTQLKAVEAVSF